MFDYFQRLDKLFAGYKWNFKVAKAKENITKNRFQDCLPSIYALWEMFAVEVLIDVALRIILAE